MFFRNAIARYKHSASAIPEDLLTKHFDDIPTPTRIPFIGSTLSLIFNGSSENLHKYIDKQHRKFGRIFRQDLGPISAVFVADPEEMPKVYNKEGNHPIHVLPPAWMEYNKLYGCKRGLFFMDGSEWQQHRKIMNNLLLKGDLNWIDRSCDAVCKNLVDSINNNLEVNNLESILYKWSLDTMVAILLGDECYRKNRVFLEKETEMLASKVKLVFETSVALQLIPANLAARFGLPQWRKFVDCADEALNLANSLLGKLELVQEQNGFLRKLQQEAVKQSDVNRIIADLILAAGDTTSYAMLWILYEIGRNERIQEKLRKTPHFSRNVIREALRLYPIAPFLTRILPQDVVLCGYKIPAGTLIVLSIYTSGRDGSIFEDSLDFRPERWDRDDGNYRAIMQKASLPFAMGSRSCIGKKIAEAQLESGIEEITKNFRFDVLNEVDVVTKMVLVPNEPIRIKFTKL